MIIVKFSAIQNSCTTDLEENLNKAESLIRKSASNGADVIALQELFSTTYFCREIDQKYFNWAEPIPGPITERFSRLAAELEIVLLLPMFERKAAGVYFNTMVVFEKDGTILGTYRKMHIPDDPGFYEKYYFTPGDKGYKVFDTSAGKIGALICWDQWFPEAARLAALEGAEILVYPTAIGTLPEESDTEKREFMDAWLTIQRSHAIANGCFVAGINRVGVESGTKFWGNSFVAGPFGQILAQAGENEEILSVHLDLSSIEKQRQTWPFFRDRRIDSYKDLLKRFK
ncbi:carbon-nitrogen hydrolase [Rhodohalobacter barkolensis]|uniref:Acyltransferase n=1 Tax=Rhodohalobacter barkolensis TaxID=2053187 RepID=A0A2N0VK38_9BACT|nr:acyltransferase [Rhodohalobacter barkolensis]